MYQSRKMLRFDSAGISPASMIWLYVCRYQGKCAFSMIKFGSVADTFLSNEAEISYKITSTFRCNQQIKF